MEWLEKANPNFLTAALGFVTLVVAIWAARLALIPHFAERRRDRILDTRGWGRMIAGLNPDWATRYYSAIAASRGWFDRVYGAKLWSWHAFDRALLFAFVYASLSLMIGWVAFDAGHLGGAPFLPEGLPLWRRAAILTVALVWIGLTLNASRFLVTIWAWLTTRIQLPSAVRNSVSGRFGLSEKAIENLVFRV